MRGSHDDLVLRAQELARRSDHSDGTLKPISYSAIEPIAQRDSYMEQVERELYERGEYRRSHRIRYAWKRFTTSKFYAFLCYVFGYLAILLAASAVLRAFHQTKAQSFGFFGALIIFAVIGKMIGASLSGHWTLYTLFALFRRRMIASAAMIAVITIAGGYLGIVNGSRPASLPIAYNTLQAYNQALQRVSATPSPTTSKVTFQIQVSQSIRQLESATTGIQAILPLMDNETLTAKLNTLVQTTNEWTKAMDECEADFYQSNNQGCVRAGDDTFVPMTTAYHDALNTYNEQYQNNRL